MYHDDPAVLETLRKNRFLTKETRSLIRELESNADAQIDRAILAFSMKSPVPDMVDVSRITPEQKERYKAILGEYCSQNPVEDFSFISDPELKTFCVSVQIDAMKKRIGSIDDKARLFTHLANLYYLLDIQEEATRYYRMSLDANPEYEVPYFNLGFILSKQNRFEEAAGMFEKVARLTPYNVEVYFNWGHALLRTGKLDEAARTLKRALSLDPEHAAAHRTLADVYTAQGKTTEARRHIEAAEKIEQGGGKP